MAKIATVNGLRLCYEVFGDSKHPAVLMIMGNSAQGIMWPDAFCTALAAQDQFVIRFDNRDTGKSTCIDYAKHPYDLFDLARDALGLLDHLGISRAHIVGLSMGGAIAQLLALHHPDRVLTLTTMMSSPDLSVKNDAFGKRPIDPARLPPPSPEYVDAVIAVNSRPATTPAEKLDILVDNWRLANGDQCTFDEAFWRDLLDRSLKREEENTEAAELKIANQSNHAQAQQATAEPNLDSLSKISRPTLVIQGKADPIFPPAHSQAIADRVPGAKLLLIERMGHALAPEFFDEIISAIGNHTELSQHGTA